MKKYMFLIMVLVFILLIGVNCYAFDITKSPQKVIVDDEQVNFEVYNIDGSNYFKLRDIAYVLMYTDVEFSVDYDHELQQIVINTDSIYEEAGGELSIGNDKSSTAIPSNQKLIVDGRQVNISAYNIGGNNFFKLRDLGKALSFGVDYDGTRNCVLIKSEITIDTTDFFPLTGMYVNSQIPGVNINIIMEEERIRPVVSCTGYISVDKQSYDFKLVYGISGIEFELEEYNNIDTATEYLKLNFVDGKIKVEAYSPDSNSPLNKLNGIYTRKAFTPKGWNGVYVKGDDKIVLTELTDKILFVCVNSFGTHTSDFNSSRIVCKDKYTIDKTPNGIAVVEKISNDLNYETILGNYIQKQ